MTPSLPVIPASTETVGGLTNYNHRQLVLPEQGLPPCTEPLPFPASPAPNPFGAMERLNFD